MTTDVDYLDTWRAMEKLVDSGRVRSIGISNFNSQQTDRILSIAKILPVTNQIECHPNLNQRKLIDFSAARNISITAYSPLGRPHTQSGKKLAITNAKVLELAQKYHKTPAQIILRYTVSSNVCTQQSRFAQCRNQFKLIQSTYEWCFVPPSSPSSIVCLFSGAKWCNCYTKIRQSKSHTREFQHFRFCIEQR